MTPPARELGISLFPLAQSTVLRLSLAPPPTPQWKTLLAETAGTPKRLVSRVVRAFPFMFRGFTTSRCTAALPRAGHQHGPDLSGQGSYRATRGRKTVLLRNSLSDRLIFCVFVRLPWVVVVKWVLVPPAAYAPE